MKEKNTIHPEVKKLLKEVFGWFSEEEGKRAGEYPEAHLMSLLESIKEYLPKVSTTLSWTVGMARFGDSTLVFKERLATVKRKLAAVQPNGKMQSRKLGNKSLKHQRPEKIAA